jgi:hypothetical protein
MPANRVVVTDDDIPAEESQQDSQAAESTNETPERPEWLPEKFDNPEDMAKAYADLERKLHSGGSSKTDESSEASETEEEGKPLDSELTIDESEQTVETPDGTKIDLSDFYKEFSETGQISDDSYQKLEEMGFDRSVVDTYVEGQKALVAQRESQVMEAVGGQDQYQAMLEWAKANLSAEEKQAFNRAVSQDVHTAKIAVRGLEAQYTAANGREGRMAAGSSSNRSGEVYESNAQFIKDLQSSEYQTDPAFRQKVDKKLEASMKAGTL